MAWSPSEASNANAVRLIGFSLDDDPFINNQARPTVRRTV
jgi:hypothetical protein